MVNLLLAAHFLGLCCCQTPTAQTASKINARLRPAPKPHLSGRRNSIREGVPLHAALLQGAWSDCRDCNAIFWMEGHQVNFFDEIGSEQKEGPTSWKIAGNKLSFCYSGGLVVTDTIIKLTKDSLVLYRRDKEAGVVGYSRYVRLK